MNSIEFLQQLYPDYPWVLTAIHPERTEDNITTTSFQPGEVDDVLAWIEAHEEWNLYYSVNPPRYPKVHKKLTKQDIRAVRVFHVDLDPEPHETVEEARARISSLLTDQLPANIPPPTYIISSGGGYQALWRLTEDIDLGEEPDPVKIHDAERYNRRLEQVFKADACHNVDRLMRLPGTMNWPDKKKKLKGRTPQPAVVVAHDDTARYPRDMFSQAVKAQTGDMHDPVDVVISGNLQRFATVDDIPNLPEKVASVIELGYDPEDPMRWPSQSEMVFWVVCRLVENPLIDDDMIYSIITDREFVVSEHVLRQSDVDRYARRQISRAKEQADSRLMIEMNDKHAYVEDYGGRGVIMTVYPDHDLSFIRRPDFVAMYMNQFVDIPAGDGKVKSQQLGEWWLRQPSRRQYRRVVFDPTDSPSPDYNIWRGFQHVNEDPGPFDKFMGHIKNILCEGDEALFDWLVGWMAFAVQHPDRPPGSAVVLQGEEGTGKSFFAKMFGELFGVHFKHVTDAKHLTGSFNAHLHGCVLLFADEAFYAGDKSQDGRLKTLITEEQMQIERKGYDAEQMQNTVHLIMASNEDWVVPAGKTARRYFVLRVSKDHANDSEYFKSIADQMKDGGYAGLLQYLLDYDLTSWSRYKVPITPALRDQQRRSLDPMASWWLTRLEEHSLLSVEDGWPPTVERQELYEDYRRHCRDMGNNYPVKPSAFHWDCLGFGLVEGKKDPRSRKLTFEVPPVEELREKWEAARGEGGWAWSE